MIRVIDERNSFKTGRVLLLAKERNATIVAVDPGEIVNMAAAFGITDVEVISHTDFVEGKLDPDKDFFIDNIDLLPFAIIKAEGGAHYLGFSATTRDIGEGIEYKDLEWKLYHHSHTEEPAPSAEEEPTA